MLGLRKSATVPQATKCILELSTQSSFPFQPSSFPFPSQLPSCWLLAACGHLLAACGLIVQGSFFLLAGTNTAGESIGAQMLFLLTVPKTRTVYKYLRDPNILLLTGTRDIFYLRGPHIFLLTEPRVIHASRIKANMHM